MPDIDDLKLELEKNKLRFDEHKFEAENTFFRKNSTAMLTLAGTFIAAILSGTQVWVAYIEKQSGTAPAKTGHEVTLKF